MDPFVVMQRVPQLLDVCVQDNITVLRSMRLVSKEASRVALLGLRSYTLTLEGHARDTNVNGARLLSQTHLGKLSVHLSVTGTFSSAILLKAFVAEARASLSTIISINLHVENTCGSAVAASLLFEAVGLLLRECPALKTLHSQGHLSADLLRMLGHVCPSLSALSFDADGEDIPYLQQMLQLQPLFFSRIDSISFPRLSSELPDMSENSSILSVTLEGYRFISSDLLLMPPKLQHLIFESLDDDWTCTVATQNAPSSLHTIEFSSRSVPLHGLAQLLRSAPALQKLTSMHMDAPYLTCYPLHDLIVASASDLAILQSRVDIELISNLQLVFTPSSDIESMQSYVASLPCMTGFTRLEVMYFGVEVLVLLLKKFPDVQNLGIKHVDDLDDVELQVVERCLHLTHLCLMSCNNINLTSLGLYALCLRLPRLVEVACVWCRATTQAAIEMCNQLLDRQGSLTRICWED